MDNALLTSIE
jgi:hypothetical protein